MALLHKGDKAMVEAYVKNHENSLKTLEYKSKRAPLHIAAKHGHLDLADYIIQRGSEIELRDKLMKTPLHYACEGGHNSVVELLLDCGADPFETDNSGRNAMHYAVYSG